MQYRRTLAAIVLGLWFASSAPAYYFYVHYNGRNTPFSPMVEKFDLTALPNKTVQFYVSDQGPSAMAPGDSFAAIVSEIRAAAKVWNDVGTSDLRLAYGGLISGATVTGGNYSSQAIEVDFSDDVPPGLVSYTGVESSTTSTGSPAFFPIQRAHVILRRDLSHALSDGSALASFSELFFTTVVHEFGHALGLQHTLTSSVMSTAVTSASTKAAPLAADDLAGVSLLYPAAGYSSSVGNISGRVTYTNGSGVGLASVVAISTSSAAVSTLTNPDGTFEIGGLNPQQYYLYVHPLPSPLQGESFPANITPPVDQNRVRFSSGSAFTTQFYPGTRDFNQAQWVFVYAGNLTGNVNFTVTPRTAPAVASVRVYGYTSTNVAVTSPQLFVGIPTTLVAGSPTGLLQNNNLTPGLTVGLLGTAAQIYDLRPYYGFVALDAFVGNTAGPGPKHLAFTTPTDLYVLPSAFTVVQNPAPAINGLSAGTDASGNRVVAISGSNLQPDTRYYFDGIPATVSGTTPDGKVQVIPPAATGGYTAAVVALNSSDAQSSLFLQGSNPVTYTYDPAPSAAVSITPQYLTPSLDTTVDILTQNTSFVDGQVTVGFGSPDIVVKKVQVVSPTHLVVTATAPAGNFIPTMYVNITHGLRVLALSQGTSIQSQPAQP